MTQRRVECVFLRDRSGELSFDQGEMSGGLFYLRSGFEAVDSEPIRKGG